MSLRDRASILLERHAQALLGSLGRLARQPFATLLTVLVIGIALALPATLYLAVANMRDVTAGLDDTVQLSAYLEMETTPAEAKARADAIAALPGAQKIFLVFGLWLIFQTSACSRPPLPMTRIFIYL